MKVKNKKGNIIIVSAPSGAGKTSICNKIVKKDSNTVYSISYTTRKPRKGEKDGIEYFFTSETKFKKMIKEKKFIEWAKVHNNYYGTPKSFIDKTIKSGKNVLLDIDVQGGVNIKKFYNQACMIFVMTPDIKTLKERLMQRNQDSKQIIAMRLENAKKELRYLEKYEYLVINENLQESIKTVEMIIKTLDYKIQKNTKYF